MAQGFSSAIVTMGSRTGGVGYDEKRCAADDCLARHVLRRNRKAVSWPPPRASRDTSRQHLWRPRVAFRHYVRNGPGLCGAGRIGPSRCNGSIRWHHVIREGASEAMSRWKELTSAHCCLAADATWLEPDGSNLHVYESTSWGVDNRTVTGRGQRTMSAAPLAAAW